MACCLVDGGTWVLVPGGGWGSSRLVRGVGGQVAGRNEQAECVSSEHLWSWGTQELDSTCGGLAAIWLARGDALLLWLLGRCLCQSRGAASDMVEKGVELISIPYQMGDSLRICLTPLRQHFFFSF